MDAIAKRWSVVLSAFGLAAAAALGMGCAIHTQGPIQEVAYDFSDSDFYDRDYAPSPSYRQVEAYDPAHLPAAPLELAEAAFPATVDAPEVSAADADELAEALAAEPEPAQARGGSSSWLGVRVPAPTAD